MPFYNYLCESCEFVFEKSHGIHEKPEVPCPKCNKPTGKTFLGMTFHFHVRGDGLVKDKAGARRDMSLHRLMKDDPYGRMRQPGEKDDLANKLRRGGKHQRNAKTFVTRGLK
jgi:putative FmdB family regulatory protein